jgi:uncharacterized protein DUF7005
MSLRTDHRTAILTGMTPDAGVIGELLSYDRDGFGDELPRRRVPMADEPFVDTWRTYAHDVSEHGIGCLADRLVQLQFPVADGISETDAYRAATRRGDHAGTAARLTLNLCQPEACSILIHWTWAGSIPVIQTGCREDFVSLLRAFTMRNEPRPVPESMGACIVGGYNNWDRFEQAKQRWMLEHPGQAFTFGCVADATEEYRDRLILLSPGWYSHVPPERLGLSESTWRDLSLAIRREHESTHYCTRRLFSVMRNSLLDEIIADACGIVAALGAFRADWLLAFLGLDQFPLCRAGGRIHNYRGTPPLSDAAFSVLQRMVVSAATNLERFTRAHRGDMEGPLGILLLLVTLSRMSVETLSSEDAGVLLDDSLELSRRWARGAGALGPLHSRVYGD